MSKADELFYDCGHPNSFTITKLRDYAKGLENSVLDAQADTAAIEKDNADLRIQLDEARTLAETRLARIHELQRNIRGPEEHDD